MVYKSGQIFLPFCQGSSVWQTDGRTDRRTEFSSLYRICITCSAVKINVKNKGLLFSAFAPHLINTFTGRVRVSVRIMVNRKDDDNDNAVTVTPKITTDNDSDSDTEWKWQWRLTVTIMWTDWMTDRHDIDIDVVSVILWLCTQNAAGCRFRRHLTVTIYKTHTQLTDTWDRQTDCWWQDDHSQVHNPQQCKPWLALAVCHTLVRWLLSSTTDRLLMCKVAQYDRQTDCWCVRYSVGSVSLTVTMASIEYAT